ncbi:MAG TPA: RsmB/NOP family class I SAM-dependent RNA methyltransferase [Myxococcales bacterium]|nr:RsmB/NOP family class I SAM-dependent RNA methyltransferase [Myxococcales bacterium]
MDFRQRLRGVPWDALDIDAAPPALAAVLSGAPAEREVERVLRANRGFSGEQRRAMAEAIFGVGLWRRRLAWQARLDFTRLYIGAPAPHPMAILSAGSDIPLILLACLIRDLAFAPLAPRLAIHAPPPRDGEPPRLADRWSLPDWLEAVLERELGDPDAFCAAVATPGPVCLRANRLLNARDELAAALRFEGIETRPALRAPDALVVETPQANLFGCAAWREGRFEPQDEGSQLLGSLVEPAPGDTVLDLCAGAGGKSLLLAAQGARVFAHDIDAEKLTRLRARARRARADAAIEIVPAPRFADRVLIDAPCSELGALRRGPDLRWRLQPDPSFPKAQRALLETAAPLARERLVYATCTLTRAENEEVAEEFEQAHTEFRRARELWRVLPHTDGTDGFFAAVWDRR